MFNKIKNKKRLGIIFITVALILGGFGIYNYTAHKKDVSKAKVEREQSKISQEVKPEVTPNIKKDEEEHTDTVISTSGIPEDALKLIDGKEAELLEAIQIWANSYGYRFQENAFFEGSVTIDYNQDTVAISFYLEDEFYTKFDVVYNRKTKEFSVVPW